MVSIWHLGIGKTVIVLKITIKDRSFVANINIIPPRPGLIVYSSSMGSWMKTSTFTNTPRSSYRTSSG